MLSGAIHPPDGFASRWDDYLATTGTLGEVASGHRPRGQLVGHRLSKQHGEGLAGARQSRPNDYRSRYAWRTISIISASAIRAGWPGGRLPARH